MSLKCAYCGEMITSPQLATTEKMSSSETISFTCCCEECESKALGFFRFYKKAKNVFIIGITAAIGLLFTSVFYLAAGYTNIGGLLLGGSISLMGTVTTAFPFATPQTFTLFGIQKTTILTRLIGILVIFLGPVLAYWMQE